MDIQTDPLYTQAVIDAKDVEIEVLCAALARTRERAVLDFAKFLHSLPADQGWDVGPARVKFTAHGALESGPLWATKEDTERWAQAFLGA